MKRETITEGPTVEEAVDLALTELGVQQDAVEFEVLEEGGKRLFGLGSERAARVRVWLRSEFLVELESRQDEAEGQEEAESLIAVSEEVVSDATRSPVSEATEELTEEELDRVADESVSTIQSVLDGFGIEASVEEYEGDEGEIILDIVGEDLGLLIGRHGRTLDALQVVVSAITSRRMGFRHPVLVDVEGYRNRRRAKLEEIAQRAAERAMRQGSPVKLRPMSSLERRVVHLVLRDDVRVTTASDGDEPFRAVVVTPSRR